MNALRFLQARPWLSLLLLALAVNAPFWFEPFGTLEQNLGAFMGTYVRNWQAHGWWELRGAPLGVTLLDNPAQSDPYFNHPAGLSWIFTLVGGSEWAIRATLTGFAWLAATALHGLLRPRLDDFSALVGAAVLLVVPLFGFHAASSYEVAVVACGLLAMWGLDRARLQQGPRSRRLLMVCSASLLGPLLDWTYGFWCVGIAILALTVPSPAPTGTSSDGRFWNFLTKWSRAIAPTALCAAASVSLVLVWLRWSKSAPFLETWRQREEGRGGGVVDLLKKTVFDDRPSFAHLAESSWSIWVEACTVPAIVVAVLGAVVLVRRKPLFLTALAIPVILHVLLFARHATFHPMQHGHGAPAFAAGCAAAVWLAGRLLPRAVATLLAAALVAWLTSALVEHRLHNRTDFFADEGRILSEAAGSDEAPYVVVHSWQYFGNYVDHRRVAVIPMRDPAFLQVGLQALPKRRGARYLWLDFGDSAPPAEPFEDHPLLTAWLRNFPSERLPELEGDVPSGNLGQRMTVREARLYTLRDPER